MHLDPAVSMFSGKTPRHPALRNGLPAVALAAASLLAVPGTCTGQQTPPAPETHASSPAAGPTITLPFFLLAAKDTPVATVAKEDLSIGEDGHPETVQSVASAAAQPLSLAILVDTRASLGGMVQAVRTPLQQFADALLAGNPASQAAVIDFNDDAGLDLPLTAARDKVHKAFDKLSPLPDGAYSTTEVDRNVRGNVLFDALFLASDEVLKSAPGRRTIVVVTDGLDRGSKENLLSAIEAAQRAHVPVFSIQYPAKEKDAPQDRPQDGQPGQGGRQGGIGFPGGGGGYPGGGRRGGGERAPAPKRKDAGNVLMQLSADTGGHWYDISPKSKLTLEQALASIQDQLKAEYLLTYALSKEDREEGFHRLQWTPKQKDQSVQAAGGFYIDRP